MIKKRNAKSIKKLVPIIMIMLLSLTVVACAPQKGGGQSEPAAIDQDNVMPSPEDAPWKNRDNDQVTVNAGFAKGMTGIANQFAIANGWYKEAGIELDLLDIPNPVSAFGAGEVDIADGDPGTYIPAIANNVPMKIVSNMWRSRGAYWIVANAEIETWDDLKGKTIGSGQATGGMKLTLMEVLNQNGIDPEKDVELVNNDMYQTAYATLSSGEVDATIIHQPYATLAEKDGIGNILGKTWEFLPEYHTGVVVASQRMIDEQPEIVERVLEVYFYVNQYAKTHMDEFIPWAAKYLNLDEETAREAIEAESELWENYPIVDTDRLQVTQDLLYEYGMQRESHSVEGVVDNEFAKKVAEKLGLE